MHRALTILRSGQVTALLRGLPSTTLTISLCAKPSMTAKPALTDEEVERAAAWAARRSELSPHAGVFRTLLKLLQPVSLQAAQVCKTLGFLSPCTELSHTNLTLSLVQISPGTVIGKGAAGTIVRAEIDCHSPRPAVPVAVKNIDLSSSRPLGSMLEEILRELTLTIEISKGCHPSVVGFLGAAVRFPAANAGKGIWEIGLVFELCDPYDLYHLLHTHQIKLTLSQKLMLAREAADGLAYLHSLDILHLDFGSRNLLIKERHVKITDFGLARKLPPGSEHYQPKSISGTLQWMAPEAISGNLLCKKADVFSLGTVVWELLSETVPFSDVQDPTQQNVAALRKALNAGGVFVAGWPFREPPLTAGNGEWPVSKTLLSPGEPWSAHRYEVGGSFKGDLTLLILLMHQHERSFRPSSREAEVILSALYRETEREKANTSRDNGEFAVILEKLNNRLQLAEQVVQLYKMHDASKLQEMDTGRWQQILRDPQAWSREVAARFKVSAPMLVSGVASESAADLRGSNAEDSTRDRPRSPENLHNSNSSAPSWSAKMAPLLKAFYAQVNPAKTDVASVLEFFEKKYTSDEQRDSQLNLSLYKVYAIDLSASPQQLIARAKETSSSPGTTVMADLGIIAGGQGAGYPASLASPVHRPRQISAPLPVQCQAQVSLPPPPVPNTDDLLEFARQLEEPAVADARLPSSADLGAPVAEGLMALRQAWTVLNRVMFPFPASERDNKEERMQRSSSTMHAHCWKLLLISGGVAGVSSSQYIDAVKKGPSIEHRWLMTCHSTCNARSICSPLAVDSHRHGSCAVV